QVIFLDHFLDILNRETIEVRFHCNIAQFCQFGQVRLTIMSELIEVFDDATMADNIQRLMRELAQNFKEVEHLLKVVLFENEHMLAHTDAVYVVVKEKHRHRNLIVPTSIMPDSE